MLDEKDLASLRCEEVPTELISSSRMIGRWVLDVASVELDPSSLKVSGNLFDVELEAI